MNTQNNVVKFTGSTIPINIPNFGFMNFSSTPPQNNNFQYLSSTPPQLKIKNNISYQSKKELIDGIDISIPYPTDEEEPDLIKATYTTDLDLLKIHETIRNIFSSKLFKKQKELNEIEKLKELYNNKHLSVIEADKIKNDINTRQNEIISFENGTNWNNYVKSSLHILKKYIPLRSNYVKGIAKFNGLNNQDTEDLNIINERLSIIDEYLKIAQHYIKLDITKEVKDLTMCPACGYSFEDMYDDSVNSGVCECGYEKNILIKGTTYKDSVRVNVGGRISYEDRTTFIRAFNHHMGVDIGNIPEKLYTMLDSYFTSQNFPTGEYFKQQPLLENGKKNKTSIKLMAEALSSTHNASFYTYINYICHKYWSWELPKIKDLKDSILEDYDKTQIIYDENKERDSSLNVQIRLFYHLSCKNYPCNLDDFKILSSRASLKYHHRMFQIMSEKTGLPHISII